jgi:ribonuclease P protein component
VLARANRLTTASDYKTTIRRGRRHAEQFTVVSVLPGADSPTRFGFIVSKKVGNAPTRNRVRRRLKAIAFEAISEVPTGCSIVIRALPTAAEASWGELRADVLRSVSKVGKP